MRRRVAILSLAFAWLCANGAIWDLAQVLVWGKMFATYSTTLSVGAALRATLDPAQACELCVGVATAKEQSSQTLPGSTGPATKLVLALEADAVVLSAPAPRAWPLPAVATLTEWHESVPVPPPRG